MNSALLSMLENDKIPTDKSSIALTSTVGDIFVHTMMSLATLAVVLLLGLMFVS
ncbi:hypothetical protein [Vibrio jasicida]|uniref:hypothetical protein n=1 Tax=Vibrio jasicida TaxID=766224 RepID=UPI000AE29F90|nr:hypothetical protein [Vibrio jasicida]